MSKPFDVTTANLTGSKVAGANYLLEQTMRESASLGSGASRLTAGSSYEALVLDSPKPHQTTRPANRNHKNAAGTKRVRHGKPSSAPHQTHKTHKNRPNSNSGVSSAAGQNRPNNPITTQNPAASASKPNVVANPATTLPVQSNDSAQPVAASASSIAKERAKMNETLNGVLQGVVGKNGFVAPTDHRGYTTMINKAAKSIKNPAERDAFIAKIEEAGKPFRLNFGLSRTVGGKKEALNSKAVGTFDALHQGEYQKIAAEYKSKPVATGGSGQTSPSSTPGAVNPPATSEVKPIPSSPPTQTPGSTAKPIPAPAVPVSAPVPATFENQTLIA